ncbi:MAG: M23 family metallopeptidase [Ignavibacteria bacterium]|nr:M23 family metallopeptidase [Ignavibacteria bacterium]
MKKLFYFSKASLKYIEIRNFKLKLFSLLLGLSLLFTSIFLALNHFLAIDSNSKIKVSALKNENEELKEEIKRITKSYHQILGEVDSISVISSQLRIAANLEAITDEERLLGTGGSSDYLSANLNIKDIEVKNLLESVDEMIRYVQFEKEQTLQIANKLSLNEKLHKCIPAIKPTIGNYTINDFGMRRHPILGVRRFHEGIDINCDYGTEVHCSGEGKVIAVERRAGFGLVVEIDHGFGYSTIYAHLSKAKVKKGNSVTRGQIIAKSGNSGLSTGPHLHYEVRHDGIPIDPTDFFFDDLTFFDLDSQ